MKIILNIDIDIEGKIQYQVIASFRFVYKIPASYCILIYN